VNALERFSAEVVDLHRTLVRVSYAMSGDAELAEDCAQEALLRAWQRLESGERIDRLEAWSVTVALNCCRSQLRRTTSDRRKAERLVSERATTPPAGRGAPAPATTIEDDDVRLAVLALPRRQREVVVLRYLLDMDVAGIAESVGRSEGAVKNALHHARSTLARSLGTPAGPTEEAP
jgi:RNA polymerase sigma factor (sigma-70 family)